MDVPMVNPEDLRLQIRSTLMSIHDIEYFKNVRSPTKRTDMDHALKHLVFKYLYFVVTDSGKQLKTLFPNKEHYVSDMDQVMNVNCVTDFYKISVNSTAKSKMFRHQGRNCGRKFKVGEPLYRCQECAYDDTCVLCIHCFNPKDHEGHHIYTDICNEFTSGICDCGDDEAWHKKLNCKAEEDGDDVVIDDEEELSFDTTIMEVVLSEIFDYFIDLFNQAIESLPTFTPDITLRLRQLIQSNDNESMYALLNDLSYRNEKVVPPVGKPGDYTVMIYNDEYHNYSQATMALRQGVPDNIHTDILTSKIDSEGRAMLKCSDDVHTLTEGFFAVQTNGLSATLTSWPEYIHQETCKYIIQWCNHCLSIPNHNFQSLFRDTLGKVLSAEYTRASETTNPYDNVKKYFNSKLSDTNPYRCLDASILSEDNKLPIGHHKRINEDDLTTISNSLNKLDKIMDKQYTNSRLQYILYFDNRYWKKLRKEIQNVIIPTLASSLTYKPIFCEQVVQIFNHISRSITYMDREPQLSALRECIVQLFTCPTNALIIFTHPNGYFIDILWSIIDIFVDFCKFENGTLIWQRVQKTNPTKSFGISFKQGLYTIETLLSKIEDSSIIMQPMEFISLATLCKLFNGAWKIKRKEGEHVLHEDQHFIPYLEHTTSIYSIIQTIENRLVHKPCSEQLLLNCIKLLNTFLSHKSLTYKLINDTHEVVKFVVSKDRVAFMNPIQTLFSFLIEKVSLTTAYDAIMYSDAISSPNVEESFSERKSEFDFLKISDFSLRSIVLCSQIDIGFWVRNGMSVLHQASYYKKNPELNSYSRDIHLNQLAFLWELDDVPRIVYNMLDRWELLDWFVGNVSYENTVYKDKIASMVQQFITFVYQVLTERQFYQKFETQDERQMTFIKNAIIYSLYQKPLSYSKLLRLVPDYYTENANDFDAALEEVSIFIEPKGLADNAVFKLKDLYYSKIDPLRLANLGNEFENSATMIRTHIAKIKKEDMNNIILQPQIVSPKNLDADIKQLGGFSRNPVFVKIIYKLLQTSLDKEDTTYLNELLHLIHAIFKDDEQVNGKQSVPDTYIKLPICSLLLSIVNSKSNAFSETVVNKADYLLEKMIMKRSEEIFSTLTYSFGEECVEAYKERKLNQGVNLEETERERKKRIAKKHQAKMMAKFNNLQSKFINKNEEAFEDSNIEEDGDVDMMHGEKILEGEEFSCSLCQDDKSIDIFVIPIYQDSTSVFRPSNVPISHDFMVPWGGFYNNTDASSKTETEPTVKNMKLFNKDNQRKVFVSCNHHIHYNCFKRYVQKKRFSVTSFICPLCQTYSNCVIPIFSGIGGTQKEQSVDMITEGIDNTPLTLDSVLNGDSSIKNLTKALKPASTADTKTLFSVFDMISKDCNSFDKEFSKAVDFQKGDAGLILANYWANTISMLEISSRMDKDTNGKFLAGKEQKFKTLRNMLLTIILMYNTIGKPDLGFKPHVYSSNQIENKLFQHIVRSTLFNTRGKNLKEIIADYLSDYVKQIKEDIINANFMDISLTDDDKFYDLDLNEGMKTMMIELFGDKSYDDSINYDLIYSCYLRHLRPTLRRCLIMLKVFNNLINDNDSTRFIFYDEDMENFNDSDESNLPNYIDKLISILTPHKDLLTFFKHYIIKFTEDYDYENEDDEECKGYPIENCGIIKLINLSEYLNTYVTQTREMQLREENQHVKNSKNRLDFKICLTCGVKIHQTIDHHEMTRHLMKHCFQSFGVFLLPNTSEICLLLTSPPSHIFISAPYLNSHGEAGRNAMKRGDLTKLNMARYEHLNKLWINNEIPGYISRVMGDEFRLSILSNGFLFTFNRDPRARRVPPVNGGDGEDDSDESDDLDDDENEIFGFGDDNDEEEEDNNGDRFMGPNGTTAGDVRNFFQIFENLRNGLDENGDGNNANGGIDLATPFIELLGGPQFQTGPIPPEAMEEESSSDSDFNETNG
ncbi:E3 ubiquitin-protein ligase Ubr1p [Monosporozyma unispora]